MRELSEEAMGVIAGGCYNGTCATCQETQTIDDVVVNGQRYDRWLYPGSWGYNYYNTGGTPYVPSNDPGVNAGGYGGVGDHAGYADTSSIDIEVDIARALTPDEQWAIDKLREVINETTNKINNLPDNIRIIMPDGSEVTGAELKQLWARADFLIVDGSGDQFGNNGTGRSDRNNGNPFFTIDLNGNGTPQNMGLMGYMMSPESQYFYVLHELAHVTMAGHNYFQTHGNGPGLEAYANSLARGFMEAGGFTWWDFTPTHGFGGSHVLGTGSGSGGGGGGGLGGGGGGTGGGSGDDPWTIEP